MTARRRPRRQEAQLAFEALSIEGGLLSADWLARAAQLSAGSQGEADYRLPKGLNLRDEIGRYWRIAQAHWSEFAAGRAGGADPRALADRFVHGLLGESFGFASLTLVPPVEVGGRTYPIGALALGKRVPVVVAPGGSGLDTPSLAFGDGGRRRSAFGLAQEFLNASDDALWGITSDGLTLRILRDNASLTRPSWLEADLVRIFTEECYADFAALWLIAHETRFGAADRPPTECALEKWRAAGREEGTRAREHLRRGVEDAVVALGQGFLSHPDNQALRGALESGTVTKTALFQQLLRLVYRLIFLLTAEERSVLHEPGASEAARNLYARGYSVRRLRDRSVRRSGYDRFGDLWDALKIVLRGMARGEARLGLPALGGLFDEAQCVDLDAARLENRALLLAVFRLAWLREDGGLARVNWRDMGPEELGSVYESLLELVPVVAQGGRAFSFATGAETKGNARKTTGSYYTPDGLVQVLLDRALEPIVATTIAENPERAVEALLSLSVVDPACGSGHFLLSAARRLATHVARIEANGTPSADQYRHALRQVVGRCIFGVDLNPMAVELCKVSLWMEAVEPGRPLSFLDSHLQYGNALLGATPELLAQGIPDAAWEAIEGDDKKVASALKRQNKTERAELSFDFSKAPASTYARFAAGAAAVDLENDATLDGLETKSRHWKELVASAAFGHQRFLSDLWCAAFVWMKEPGPKRDLAPTEGTFRAVASDPRRASPELRREVERLSEQYAFFHWHLAFPQAFATGGFDVVLGNPPWELSQLEEKEWFAERRPEIAEVRSGSERKRMISDLKQSEPTLYGEFLRALRGYDGASHFFARSQRFPFCGRGRINLYAVFAEWMRNLLGRAGRLGCVVPSGIGTDDTTKLFFQSVVANRALVSFYDFQNEGFFPSAGQGHMNRFCLLVVAADKAGPSDSDFVFRAERLDDLNSPDRRFSMSVRDFALLNPNTRTCAPFRSRRDADLVKALYGRVPAFVVEAETPSESINTWMVDFRQGLFNMTTDSHLFRTRAELERDGWKLQGTAFVKGATRYLPLYEAKMLQLYNHRFGDFAALPAGQKGHILPDVSEESLADPTYQPLPQSWVPSAEVASALSEWNASWLIGFRNITNDANARTLIVAVLPRAGAGNSLPLIFPGASLRRLAPCLIANMSAFVGDYVARSKMGGTNLNFYVLRQLAILSADTFDGVVPFLGRGALSDWIVPRVLELTYTAWDLDAFAHDVGYDCPPFRWDPERRFLLRCELDAAFFHLYGLSHDDTDYVMDSFPIVHKNEERAHGEYRTKRVILEIYDAMAEAARTGTPYVTRLDPPPADPRVAHSPRATS